MYGTTDSYSTQVVSLCRTVMVAYLSFIYCLQGELKHCTSKHRFMRTSHKAFIPQLAAIEHRQAQIQCIQMQREKVSLADPSPEVLEQHHVIGKSQNFPKDINIFLQKNLEDPAAKVILLFLGYIKLIEQISIGLPTEP